MSLKVIFSIHQILLQVNNIDGNKQNNDFRNLEWVTPSQNTKHAYDNGLNTNDYSKKFPELN